MRTCHSKMVDLGRLGTAFRPSIGHTESPRCIVTQVGTLRLLQKAVPQLVEGTPALHVNVDDGEIDAIAAMASGCTCYAVGAHVQSAICPWGPDTTDMMCSGSS